MSLGGGLNFTSTCSPKNNPKLTKKEHASEWRGLHFELINSNLLLLFENAQNICIMYIISKVKAVSSSSSCRRWRGGGWTNACFYVISKLKLWLEEGKYCWHTIQGNEQMRVSKLLKDCWWSNPSNFVTLKSQCLWNIHWTGETDRWRRYLLCQAVHGFGNITNCTFCLFHVLGVPKLIPLI